MGLARIHHPLEIRDAAAFESAFAALAQEPPDALVVCWDALTAAYARPIADFAVQHRLPTLTPIKAYVQAGALLSYGTSLPGQMRRAADRDRLPMTGEKGPPRLLE